MLANAPIALGAIREDGKAELQRLLEAHPGDKCLVLDPSLGSPLNHILVEGSQVLKDFGVRFVDVDVFPAHYIRPAGFMYSDSFNCLRHFYPRFQGRCCCPR